MQVRCKYCNSTFLVSGGFCSKECAKAHIYKHKPPLTTGDMFHPLAAQGYPYEINRNILHVEFTTLFNKLEEFICLGYDDFYTSEFITRKYDGGVFDDAEGDICPLPNFEHKSTGVKLIWYKYPFRSPQINKEITTDTLRYILADCEVSLKKYKEKK